VYLNPAHKKQAAIRTAVPGTHVCVPYKSTSDRNVGQAYMLAAAKRYLNRREAHKKKALFCQKRVARSAGRFNLDPAAASFNHPRPQAYFNRRLRHRFYSLIPLSFI
jgi:hypothetical protein